MSTGLADGGGAAVAGGGAALVVAELIERGGTDVGRAEAPARGGAAACALLEAAGDALALPMAGSLEPAATAPDVEGIALGLSGDAAVRAGSDAVDAALSFGFVGTALGVPKRQNVSPVASTPTPSNATIGIFERGVGRGGISEFEKERVWAPPTCSSAVGSFPRSGSRSAVSENERVCAAGETAASESEGIGVGAGASLSVFASSLGVAVRAVTFGLERMSEMGRASSPNAAARASTCSLARSKR